MYGVEKLQSELQALGHHSEHKKADGVDFVIIDNFEITLGRFKNTIIKLALQVTSDYPRNIHSSIHILSDPLLFDYKDNCTNVRNILPSKLGHEWRYWSHNFNWRGGGDARRLMSQINEVFLHA